MLMIARPCLQRWVRGGLGTVALLPGALWAEPTPQPVPAPAQEAAAPAVPAEEAQAPIQEAPAAAQPAPGALPEEPLGSGLRWGMAPIRWGGSLSEELRWLTADDQPDRFQNVQTATLQGKSYLWQPWFAQVAANLGLVTGTEHISGNGTEETRDRTTTVTGGGILSLLPASRFPFTAQYEVTDSRASGLLTTSDYTSKRLSLRQDYRNPLGDITSSASYDRSTLTSRDFGDDVVDVFSASLSKAFARQSVELQGSHTRNTRERDDAHSRFNHASLRHNYRSDGGLTVDNLLSYSNNELHTGSGGNAFDNNFRFLQATSFATWRPAEIEALDVTGGLRFFQAQNENDDGSAESRSMNGNVGATWRFSPNLSVFGALGANRVQSEELSTTLTSQSVGANYTSDVLTFGNYSYDWNASGSVTNQTGGDEPARRGGIANLGHNLSRNWALSPVSAVSASVGQAVSSSQDSVAGNNTTLTHSGNISWRTFPSENSTAYASLNAADARTRGESPSTFQLVNLQLNGQIQLSRNSSANASFTWQHTRQDTTALIGPFGEPLTSSGRSSNAYGTVGYIHAKAFGVTGLRYSALLTVNDLQFDTRLQGNVDAPQELATHSFEQRLDYRIGRLDLRLLSRIAEIDGKKNALLFFRIGRDFGEF